MAYNDFSLEMLIEQFRLQILEEGVDFAAFPELPISDLLRETLKENVLLAEEISTEKARSELIIMPVLTEIRRQLHRRISIFSGIEMNVDPSQGLRGVCDFLISLSPLQSALQVPIVAIVEAKNDNIKGGMGQCVAEMVASQQLNRAKGLSIETVFGAVTNGSHWKFLRLTENRLGVDWIGQNIQQIESIVGILVGMIREAKEQAAL